MRVAEGLLLELVSRDHARQDQDLVSFVSWLYPSWPLTETPQHPRLVAQPGALPPTTTRRERRVSCSSSILNGSDPFLTSDKWRLDKLLQRKAREGVQIFVIVYKEVSNDFTCVSPLL